MPAGRREGEAGFLWLQGEYVGDQFLFMPPLHPSYQGVQGGCTGPWSMRLGRNCDLCDPCSYTPTGYDLCLPDYSMLSILPLKAVFLFTSFNLSLQFFGAREYKHICIKCPSKVSPDSYKNTVYL